MENMQRIESSKLSEGYYRLKHESGLTVLLYPMPEYSNVYALFGTKYGSVDTCFSTADAPLKEVPAGIAHFLEHKLFEDEDGDAFTKYAKTGASANAYTSFDKTAYLFGATDNFKESLEILVSLVTKPYFTKASVEKEQGIIAQEIRMYDDNPDWQVFFNMLTALYKNHPLKIDIAGTVESISEITDELLYYCYNTFYNLNNMVLSIAGKFDIDEALEVLKPLKKAEDIKINRLEVTEPREVMEKRVEDKLAVSLPLFNIGFKGVSISPIENFKRQPIMELLMEAIIGEATEFYRSLYDTGLINASFDDEILSGADFFTSIISGESKDPDKLYKLICEEINKLRKNGIGRDNFNRAKKACYGRYIGMYSNTESIASLSMSAEFVGANAYTLLEVFEGITEDEVNRALVENIDPEYSVLSVISPKE